MGSSAGIDSCWFLLDSHFPFLLSNGIYFSYRKLDNLGKGILPLAHRGLQLSQLIGASIALASMTGSGVALYQSS